MTDIKVPNSTRAKEVALQIEDDGSAETQPLLRNKSPTNLRVSRTEPTLKEKSDYHIPAKTQLKLEKKSSTGAKKEIDSIQLADEIRGALIFQIPKFCCCKSYTVRIYLHYWIWQIPVLITNIVLFCIWNTTHNNPNPTIALTELGFLAVGPVFLSALVRDKIFLWGVYWAVKKSYVLGCTKYGMSLCLLCWICFFLFSYDILSIILAQYARVCMQ